MKVEVNTQVFNGAAGECVGYINLSASIGWNLRHETFAADKYSSCLVLAVIHLSENIP